MISLSRLICEELDAGRPFALAAILSHRGSTPRTSGSRMLVRADSTIAGTIGGGLVEARVMAACAGMLDAGGSAIEEFFLDQEIKEGMDMVCGGSLTVWIRSFVPPFSRDLKRVFQSLSALEAGGETGLIITRIAQGVPDDPCLVREGDAASGAAGSALLPRELLADIGDRKFPGPSPTLKTYQFEAYMIEPVQPRDTLFIFGAGHVGFQLGQMAHMAEFATVVIDDRREFANPERFPHARQVLVVDDFKTAFDSLAVDAGSYIVILTRGHLHDQVVLEQALGTPAAYIGMIGSRKKREQIYANLGKKGIPPSRLEQVHSPIGTKIRAETPAEIAVSIMGELILERAILKESSRRGTPDDSRP